MGAGAPGMQDQLPSGLRPLWRNQLRIPPFDARGQRSAAFWGNCYEFPHFRPRDLFISRGNDLGCIFLQIMRAFRPTRRLFLRISAIFCRLWGRPIFYSLCAFFYLIAITRPVTLITDDSSKSEYINNFIHTLRTHLWITSLSGRGVYTSDCLSTSSVVRGMPIPCPVLPAELLRGAGPCPCTPQSLERLSAGCVYLPSTRRTTTFRRHYPYPYLSDKVLCT